MEVRAQDTELRESQLMILREYKLQKKLSTLHFPGFFSFSSFGRKLPNQKQSKSTKKIGKTLNTPSRKGGMAFVYG